MNAIDLLKQQHEKVNKALDQMSKADSVDPAMISQVADELVAHMVIEEHVFYPRVKELMKDMVGEAFEEHAVARFELARAMTSRGEQQKARIMVTKELVEHHVEEEEKEMFPKVRKNIPAEELERLGLKMEAMFEKAVQLGLDALVGDGQQVLARVNGGARAGAKAGRSPARARSATSRGRSTGGRAAAR